MELFKTITQRLLRSQLVRDSAVLWVGMMAVNVSNYLFHLLMGRFLGPVNYGVLASLISLLYLIMAPAGTIQTVVMKFGAEFKADDDYSKVHALLKHLSKRLLLVGAGLFVIFVLASKLISNFLNIDSVLPVILLSFTFLVGYVVPVNRGIMQGLQEFFQLSFNLSLETVLKLLIGLALVYLGLAVNGAVIGIALAMLIAYGTSFLPLRFLFRKSEAGEIHLGKVARYSVPVFVTYLCMTAYYSVDIILVKHFFSSVQAGLYSGLAILGKIVLFASMAIVGVMFPVVAGRRQKGQEHKHYLGYSLVLVFAVSGAIVLAYFVAPSLVIKILFGAKYVRVGPYLGAFGIAMLLLALATVFVNYYLAIHRTSFVYFLTGVVLLQAALIWLFHSSIAQVVLMMILTMLVLIVGLIVYYFIVRSSLRHS